MDITDLGNDDGRMDPADTVELLDHPIADIVVNGWDEPPHLVCDVDIRIGPFV